MPRDANTDRIRETRAAGGRIDDADRRILAALSEDATLSFAALGERVGLSAPAVHERVRRLRARGVIRATVAVIDGAAIGKPLLAFIHVDTVGWGKTRALMKIAELPEVEEIHSATGDTCLILKARVASSHALEGLLARIYDVPGVQATRTYVALSTHLERTPRAEITAALGEGVHVR